MDFDQILDRAIEMLQRRGRMSYRALKRQFDLDDDYLKDLKDEILYTQSEVVEDSDRGLVWTGEVELAPSTAAAPERSSAPVREPLTYTPQYLTEKILTSRSALEGERKQVTVLFADIKDSTELIRDLDPEDAQKLLDPAIHIMMEAVHRFEGTVNQVLGDGIMSIFGAPIAHEDHAARACYAALAMQAAMQNYTDEVRRHQGLELRIRVGLNSGEVVVRTIGNDLHMDYSAVGQATHLAARMEQLAAPGSIRMSSSTLRLVEGLVQVNALGPIPVKGMDEPIEVFELTGASSVRRRLQAALARGLTKFVGRDTEIDALNQALEQAGSGHGQIVAAVGEAGVGKSRLVYEFVHSHRTQGWLVLESASVSYGKATPYFPVIDLLKRYARIEDGDDARTIRAKVTGQILTLDESLQDTIPTLLSLLDALPEDSQFLKLDPPQRRQRTLDGLKRILLRESQVQPLLLVFEDLHWIDSETQSLLDRLVESLPAAQLMLLVNYRPEYRHDWGGKTYYTQLRLDALPPESADAFLEVLLGNEPGLEALKQLLIERTAGNPFFLEESVRTLVETQALVGESGAYSLAQDLPSIQVPPTVQAILAARIDRLPENEKQLLQSAAVIGTEVPFTLLQAIAEIPDEVLHPGLTHLQAAEFLYETSLFPDRVYTFKHALTHEVAYNSLLQEHRRVLHAQIVDALEMLAGDQLVDQAERLAHHALLGEVWNKALTYFRQAGDKAKGRSAHLEAVDCFERSLSTLQHLPESPDTIAQSIDLRFELRGALNSLGEIERLFVHLQEAERLAEVLGDQHRLAWASCYMTSYFFRTGDHEYAVVYGQRALAMSTNEEDRALWMMTYFALGQAYWNLGNYQQTIALNRSIVTSLRDDEQHERFGGASFMSVISREILARGLAECGDFFESIAYGEEALRIAEAAGHLDSLIRSSFDIARVYVCKGDLSKAIPLLERGLSLCQGGKAPLIFPYIASALGHVYALCGRVSEGLSLLEQAVAQSAAMNVMSGHAIRLTYLSEAHLHAGHLETSRTLAEQALEYARTYNERGNETYALRLLGDIAMHDDLQELDQAETYYQQSLALATELGMRPLQAHCHRDLGILYQRTGQTEQARAELTTAIEMYRDMEMTFWLPETEAAVAAVEGR